MKQAGPPKLMEKLLKSLLPEESRESVSGDLYEEFCDAKVPTLGPMRARLWYARQVLSFVPQKFGSVLALTCLFTWMSGMWLGLMDLRLRHPGYAGRELIAGLIVGQAAVTLAALYLRRPGWLRPLALVGCAGILWLAGRALAGVLTGANPEGYVLLIALALIVQSVLTLLILPGLNRRLTQRA
ncbi:MAG TPA: permease prefix domain 2-containing transporter [Terracidiphilus sp.]|jgi:hypothetical protein|nr:permease prefix domain 2-containing transporter [Terracidiphilus sp.]